MPLLFVTVCAAGMSGNQMAKPRGKTWTIELECVGLQFRWKKTGREMLARSVPILVDLVREPDNPSDENAIKVVIAWKFKFKGLRGRQLGYLRKSTASLFAARLDAGTLEVVKIWATAIDAEHGNATLDCRFRDLPAPKRPKQAKKSHLTNRPGRR